MKRDTMLTIASMLSILFITLHTTDDIVRGMEPGRLFDLIVVPILAVWLYGTLVLAGRRSGYVIRALLRHPLGVRVVGASATADRPAEQTSCECVSL